jgi:hypothetical protein
MEKVVPSKVISLDCNDNRELAKVQNVAGAKLPAVVVCCYARARST